jgi:hypothetical protein
MQTQTRDCEQWQNEGQFHLISGPSGYSLFPTIADFKRDQNHVAVRHQIESLLAIPNTACSMSMPPCIWMRPRRANLSRHAGVAPH